MPTRTLDYRTLLASILPTDRLPEELRVRVRTALDGSDPRQLRDLAVESLRALEAQGLVRAAPRPENGHTRYHLLLTGEVVTIRPVETPLDQVVTTTLPAASGTTIQTARELVGLATRILSEQGDQVAETEQIIQLLTMYGRELLDCDEVRFLTLADPVEEGGLEPLRGSDSPFATVATGSSPSRIGHAWVVRDLTAGGLQPGGRNSGYRSAAAIRLGLPGDEVLGILEAWSSQPAHFNAQRLTLLELLGDTGRQLLRNSASLQKLVFIDSRTQIFNKSFFDIQLDHFLARAQREGRRTALAIADIDDFKIFNSRFGYHGGDQVLFRVAQILKSHVRPFDCVARWGGEEFAILLAPPVEREDAVAICDRLRMVIQQTAFLVSDLTGREHRTGVTVSVGGSVCPQDGQSADELWRRANEELLAAKAAGKNLVRFREPARG